MTDEENEKWGRPPCNTDGFGAAARATVHPDPDRTVSAVPPIGGTYGGRFPEARLIPGEVTETARWNAGGPSLDPDWEEERAENERKTTL